MVPRYDMSKQGAKMNIIYAMLVFLNMSSLVALMGACVLLLSHPTIEGAIRAGALLVIYYVLGNEADHVRKLL